MSSTAQSHVASPAWAMRLCCLSSAVALLIADPLSARNQPVEEANPLVGTAPLDRQELIGNAPPAGEPVYSGQTSPGARLPHSRVEAAPVNVNLELSYPTGVPAAYYYANPTMIGFTGGGGSTYGARAKPNIMPVVGNWTVPPAYTQSHYDKARETASPGYYSVYLDTFRTRVELTATRWTSMMQLTFPESRQANVIINLPRLGGTVEIIGDRVVRGVAEIGRDDAGKDVSYFVAEFSKPFASHGTFRAMLDRKAWGIGDKDVAPGRRSVFGNYAGGYVTFHTREGEKVLLKIAHGHSYSEAEQRLREESPGWDLQRIRDQARAAWDKLLGRIEVTGGTPSQRKLFYSTLYHSFASPQRIAAKGELLTDRNGQVTTAEYDRYGPVPFWDTGRNQIVLLQLLEPALIQDVMRSELDSARASGFMNTSFHGDNAVLLYLGALERGIPFDYDAAYEYLRRNATDPNGPRDHLAEYMNKGWISDIVPERNPSPPYAGGKAGADKTLEYSWADNALALLAQRLGKHADYRSFLERAGSYRNVFDPSVGFMRGRTEEGKWISPFDPGEPYYNFMMKEASGWSTLWLVPHDVQGLIKLLGGRDAFNAKLDRFFSTPYDPKGICRDCTGMIGQYVQGNQPDQHAPYLYIWSGQPWKTQALVRRILDQLYGSDAVGYGYPGMDDQGATSSWYVMSAMGFYPVDPSSPHYIIGSPIFDTMRLLMGNGKLLEIVADNNSAQNMYIQSATLNGRQWNKAWLSHGDIQNGAKLVLKMGPKPSFSWGSAPGAAPPSRRHRWLPPPG